MVGNFQLYGRKASYRQLYGGLVSVDELQYTSYFSCMSPSDTVPGDSISGLKPCEYQQRYAQAQHAYPGSRIHIPQCDDQGNFVPLQCHGSTGFCWCVDRNGHEVPGTQTPPGSTPPHCGPTPGELLPQRNTLCPPGPGVKVWQWVVYNPALTDYCLLIAFFSSKEHLDDIDTPMSIMLMS